VRTDPEMRDEFCYMLKRGDAYDWEIVDFAQKEKEMHKIPRKAININQKEVKARKGST
jgi:dynein heavy chain